MQGIVNFFTRPKWERQHRWRNSIWKNMSRLGLSGMHALPLNRRWVDIQRHDMPLQNLDPSLEGLKIVQISDLHYSPVVWRRYLLQCFAWVNELEPDAIVVTGDLITGGYRYAKRIAILLSHLETRLGVICTFGNHDYSIYGKSRNGEGQRRAGVLQESLEACGVIVLRNQSLALQPPGANGFVTLVGLDDEWSGAIDHEKAFTNVDASQPIICLNHNPANVRELLDVPWQWMLSGHTHGRQLAAKGLGKKLYPHKFRHYTHGYYSVAGRHLYVNRGLSYGQRGRDWCRPEITLFTLRCADGSAIPEAAE